MNLAVRLTLAFALSAVFPLFTVDYSRAGALSTHLLVTALYTGLFVIPISWYSSPCLDAAGATHLPTAYAPRSAIRSRVGGALALTAMAIFLAFLLFASYEFALRYEWKILGPDILLGLTGAYLYGTNMCVYCAKLNAPHLRKCGNCGNRLPKNALQPPAKDGDED